VVQQGFVNPTHRIFCHRLAVFDAPPADPAAPPAGPDADPDAAPPGHPMAIVSQSDLVSFLHRHRAALGDELLSRSLADLGFRPKPVVCVPGDMATLLALEAVVESDVRCAAVVDVRG
jgi:hypothetical protein